MKRLAFSLALLILSLLAHQAHAYCVSPKEVWFAWPEPGEPLGERGWIVLHDNFDSPYSDWTRVLAEAKLEADAGDEVPLELVFASPGIRGQMQWLLRPRSDLRAGETYHLRVDRHDFVWHVEAVPPAPAGWPGTPSVLAREYAVLGCGPESHLILSGPPGETSGLVRFRATPTAGGAALEHVVRLHEGRLDVGRGMCSGAVHLVPGTEYLLELAQLHPWGGESWAMPVRVIAPSSADPEPAWAMQPTLAKSPPRSWMKGYGLVLVLLGLVNAVVLLRFWRSRPA